MKILKFIVFVLLVIGFVSCEEENQVPSAGANLYLRGKGVFVINEGNFMGGNGSVSFYSTDSSKIYNDLFSTINERPLGDVPNSMTIHDDLGYIVVNNSGKIEVIETSTLRSAGTITGLVSPRNIRFIDDNKAYVTSLYSDSVTIIDPSVNTISGYINLRRTSESVEISGNKAFISNWAGGDEILVVNTATNRLIDSIKVGSEPESIVTDKLGNLWVLCTGGYFNKKNPELLKINRTTLETERVFVFSDKYAYPTSLSINGTKDVLMFLDNGVKKMNITDNALPTEVFIDQKSGYFYKMGIDPETGDIFVTDAIDYQQKGKVFRFTGEGVLADSVKADIIPSSLCFSSRH